MGTLELRWGDSRHSADATSDLHDAIRQCRQGLVDSVTVHTPHTHVRFQVHDIVKRRYPGMRHESRDVPTADSSVERVLSIWSENLAIDAALAASACAQPPSPVRRSRYAPRLRYCDNCGSDSDHVEILRNVHTDDCYCDACIDADEELSAHKWEP